MSQPIEQQKEEEWVKEFRDYFDKTLRPKKPSMKNLDRELCINFIHRQRQSAREEMKNELRDILSQDSARPVFDRIYEWLGEKSESKDIAAPQE